MHPVFRVTVPPSNTMIEPGLACGLGPEITLPQARTLPLSAGDLVIAEGWQ